MFTCRNKNISWEKTTLITGNLIIQFDETLVQEKNLHKHD